MSQVVCIYEYGSVDVLCIDDIDVFVFVVDEVQIWVKVIGLNCVEVMFCNGVYLQEVLFFSWLGYEVVGMIEVVGSVVSGFVVGDVVSVVLLLDIVCWGIYGELVNVLV